MAAPGASIRADKWLWYARQCKSRSLAAALIGGGHVRVNGVHVHKPAHVLVAGDVLTFPQGGRVRVLRILALGTRRGPAPEAQALYLDISPAAEPAAPLAPREGGRPTKRDRRMIDRLSDRDPS